ncbi:MAG: hypothetical protein ACOC9E_01545 [Chloroflexota bacterium]
MEYIVRRTVPETGEFPTYMLLDLNGATLLHADQSQGPPPESRRQIRLMRPGGRLLATIDVPPATVDEEEQQRDYAIVHEYAVYAIVSVHFRQNAEGNGGPERYFVLEVEGETWLLLPHPEQKACYALYDEAPAGLHTYETLTELDLPRHIGQFCRGDEGDEQALTVQLDTVRLAHTSLVVLALGLLIDQTATALS